MPYLVLANPASGGDDDLAARAVRELPDARSARLDDDLGERVAQAVAEERVVVACGGDGTVHAVAQHLAGTGGVLGVLPAGTYNHFARDLGVQDADAAIRALRAGSIRAVDVGRMQGRVFVNNLSIGLYAEVVRERDLLERRTGEWRALLRGGLRILRRFEPVEGWIAADGDRRALAAAVVFVGVNRYSTEPGSFGERPVLDGGVLDVRVVCSPAGLRARSVFAWKVATAGRWKGPIARTDAREVEIRVRGGSRPVALDGEQDLERDHVRARIEPRALRVIVPGAA